MKHGSEFADWNIELLKGPIFATADAEAFSKDYDMPGLPEMVHGSSRARFTHLPTGKFIEFNARDALIEWRRTCFQRAAPQVVHSVAWKRERANALVDVVAKEYDWTFASDYCGTLGGGAELSETTLKIPYEKLKIQEPIRVSNKPTFAVYLLTNSNSFLIRLCCFKTSLQTMAIAFRALNCVSWIAASFACIASSLESTMWTVPFATHASIMRLGHQ
jgi:hypothetical protein